MSQACLYIIKGVGLLLISSLRAVEGLTERYFNNSHAFFIYKPSIRGIDGFLNQSQYENHLAPRGSPLHQRQHIVIKFRKAR